MVKKGEHNKIPLSVQLYLVTQLLPVHNTYNYEQIVKKKYVKNSYEILINKLNSQLL